MSFAAPKSEGSKSQSPGPIIPSLNLKEISRDDVNEGEKLDEQKQNESLQSNSLSAEKMETKVSADNDATPIGATKIDENDREISKDELRSSDRKTTFQFPNKTARKKIAEASVTPDPALRVEYTDRLLAEYTTLKSKNDNRVTLDVVLDAVQFSTGLLRTLDDCAQWSSRDRFETYRDIFVALQMEKEELEGIPNVKDREMAKHNLSFTEFQSIFPGPKKNTEMEVDPLPQNHKNTPTPDPDEDDSGRAAARQLLGKLAAVPRKEIPKHSLRDRIRHAHITGLLHLSACGLKYFPGDGEFTHYMRGIKVLNLNRNQLTVLPAEMAYLPLLEHLSVSRNLLEMLPDSIAAMANLKALDVSQNQIRYLPPSIGNLRQLEV